MLLRAGNRIINTNQIVEARFSEKADKNRLVLYVTGYRGADNHSTISMEGDEAEKVWNALCNFVEDDLGMVADQRKF